VVFAQTAKNVSLLAAATDISKVRVFGHGQWTLAVTAPVALARTTVSG